MDLLHPKPTADSHITLKRNFVLRPSIPLCAECTSFCITKHKDKLATLIDTVQLHSLAPCNSSRKMRQAQ